VGTFLLILRVSMHTVIVIASEAKQSRSAERKAGLLRRYATRNDGRGCSLRPPARSCARRVGEILLNSAPRPRADLTRSINSPRLGHQNR